MDHRCIICNSRVGVVQVITGGYYECGLCHTHEYIGISVHVGRGATQAQVDAYYARLTRDKPSLWEKLKFWS